MAKKAKTQLIWQAGVDAFAARRQKVEEMRAQVRVAREVQARPGPRVVDPIDTVVEEHVRRALLTATLPLRQEIEALKADVAALRTQVARLTGQD